MADGVTEAAPPSLTFCAVCECWGTVPGSTRCQDCQEPDDADCSCRADLEAVTPEQVGGPGYSCPLCSTLYLWNGAARTWEAQA